jgi:HD-GYP domain-containing protein (c-di-GMP phosphodiesterase class II)
VVLAGFEQHHESFDGSGYPARLAGEAIALLARVIAVAERYCAAISERAYRPAVPASIALDPSISVLLERALGRWPPGTVVRLRSGETRSWCDASVAATRAA